MRISTSQKIWFIFTGATTILSMMVTLGTFFLIKEYSLLMGIFTFLLIMGVTIYKGWCPVPQNTEWTVELFGAFLTTWEAGLHICFPWMKIMQVEAETFKGEQLMPLYMNEEVREGYGYGIVDFSDGSAPVVANVYFTVIDSFKAVYNVTKVLQAIEEKMDSSIRSYLGNYTIDEANKKKVQMDLGRIMNGQIIVDNDVAKPIDDSILWNMMKDDWGIEINSVAISDIVLSLEVIEIRQRILIAQKEAEAAEFEAKTQTIRAKGDKNALELQGKGITSQVKELIDSQLSSKEAIDYLTNRIKWENIGKENGNKTLIIDNGNSGSASTGGQFAAGMAAVQNNSTN